MYAAPPLEPPSANTPTPRRAQLPCTRGCGTILSHTSSLVRHLAHHCPLDVTQADSHADSDQWQAICQHCHKSFSRPDALRRHQEIKCNPLPNGRIPWPSARRNRPPRPVHSGDTNTSPTPISPLFALSGTTGWAVPSEIGNISSYPAEDPQDPPTPPQAHAYYTSLESSQPGCPYSLGSTISTSTSPDHSRSFDQHSGAHVTEDAGNHPTSALITAAQSNFCPENLILQLYTPTTSPRHPGHTTATIHEYVPAQVPVGCIHPGLDQGFPTTFRPPPATDIGYSAYVIHKPPSMYVNRSQPFPQVQTIPVGRQPFTDIACYEIATTAVQDQAIASTTAISHCYHSHRIIPPPTGPPNLSNMLNLPPNQILGREIGDWW